MLKRLTQLPSSIDGFEAIGKVSKDDYEQVVEPAFDDARRDGRRMRLLYDLGPRFTGFTAGAAWADAKLGLRSLRLFEGCAVVTDFGWVRDSARLAAFMMPCPVRLFRNGERAMAVEWLRSLPAHPAVSHRLIPDSGVIVVEVHGALDAHDFDALDATADAWIESHGPLAGLVIHVRQFPGWENIGSLLRHVRFVRDHHRSVERVALATDAKTRALLPELSRHFIAAELQPFGYDALDAAIAWASEPRAGRGALEGVETHVGRPD